jgi:N-acetylglucosamine-6-phosphate deacetylase
LGYFNDLIKKLLILPLIYNPKNIMNSPLIISAASICIPFEMIQNGNVVISNSGVIETIYPLRPESSDVEELVELKGFTLIPGLIDIHVHGGHGVTFGEGSLAPGLDNYSKFAASHGVTGFLLSITGPDASSISETIKLYVEILNNRKDWPGAIPLGFHLEGPFLNLEKHGAFNPLWIHNPDPDEVKAFLDAGKGWIKQVSMAPELPGSEKIARLFVDAGVVVSLGHSNTDYETASTALSGLFTHVTHTFNAQSPLHHREPGVVGAVLVSDNITAELIGDILHVHPAAMKILYRCLGPERIVLITDAMAGAGMPDGEYDLLNQKVTVRDGKATLPDGTIGGSTTTLDLCLRIMVQHVGASLSEAVRMVSFNPAKVIGEENRIGSIEVGKEANLVFLDESLNVVKTIIKGKIVFSKEIED